MKSAHDRLFNTDINNITLDDYIFFSDLMARKFMLISIFTWMPIVLGSLTSYIFVEIFGASGLDFAQIIGYTALCDLCGLGFCAGMTKLICRIKSLKDLGVNKEDYKKFKREKGFKRIKQLIKEYENSPKFKIDSSEEENINYENQQQVKNIQTHHFTDEEYYEIFPDMNPNSMLYHIRERNKQKIMDRLNELDKIDYNWCVEKERENKKSKQDIKNNNNQNQEILEDEHEEVL